MRKLEPEFLDASSLDWALQHVKRYGVSDFIPFPFEINCISSAWEQLKTQLVALDLATYTPAEKELIAVPKPDQSFRVCGYVGIIDSIVLAAMAHQHLADLEKMRVATNNEVVYSYRFDPSPSGNFFSTDFSWRDYRARLTKLSKDITYRYALSLDIADCFNQIYLHRVQAALESAGLSNNRSLVFERVLMAMSGKTSRGLPVGPHFSRVFAEIVLHDLDRYIMARHLTHVRFVDDIVIYFKKYSEAQTFVQEFTKYLYTQHRLILQSNKTRILKTSTFLKQLQPDPVRSATSLRSRRRTEEVEKALDELHEMTDDIYASFDETDIDRTVLAEIEVAAQREAFQKLFDLSIEADEIDYSAIRYALLQATRIETDALISQVVSKLELLAPVMQFVVQYLMKVIDELKPSHRKQIMLFCGSYGGAMLEFVQLWMLELLVAHPKSFGENLVSNLIRKWGGQRETRYFARYALNIKDETFVRERREKWLGENVPSRCAIIFAAQLLPKGERGPFLDHVKESGGQLESIVATAVKKI